MGHRHRPRRRTAAGSSPTRPNDPATLARPGAGEQVGRTGHGGPEPRRPDQPLHSGLIPMARLYLIRHGKPAATWGEDDDDPGPGRDRPGAGAGRARLAAGPAGGRAADAGGELAAAPLPRDRRSRSPRPWASRWRSTRGSGEIPTPAALTPERAAGLAARGLRRDLGARSRATSTTTPGARDDRGLAAGAAATRRCSPLSWRSTRWSRMLLGDDRGAGLPARPHLDHRARDRRTAG